MPPKKKNQAAEEDLGLMRAARFGRVKNTLTMGFVGLPNGSFLILLLLFYYPPIPHLYPLADVDQLENRRSQTNWPEPLMRKLPTMCV